MILNGHGGNTAAIQAVGSHLYRKGAYLAILNWWIMAVRSIPNGRAAMAAERKRRPSWRWIPA